MPFKSEQQRTSEAKLFAYVRMTVPTADEFVKWAGEQTMPTTEMSFADF